MLFTADLKFQYQMTKTGLEFWILVIVIYLLFEICDFEFLVTSADCLKKGKTIEAPSGGSPKPGPSGSDFLFMNPKIHE